MGGASSRMPHFSAAKRRSGARCYLHKWCPKVIPRLPWAKFGACETMGLQAAAHSVSMERSASRMTLFQPAAALLPEAVSIRFCCCQLHPIRLRNPHPRICPSAPAFESGLPTCHSLAEDILGLWQVQPQMESKHTIPFVRVKISKDGVRRSAGAS